MFHHPHLRSRQPLLTTDNRVWRFTTWPMLVMTVWFLVVAPNWGPVFEIWANELPEWNETNIPIEFSYGDQYPDPADIKGRGIVAKAGALGNHPVLIYEFVRNEIEYDPYAGARYGAVGTLERGKGNDADQALLLAALLRAAYQNLSREEPDLWLVKGDIELTGEQALQWFGAQDLGQLDTMLAVVGIDHEIIRGNDDNDHRVIINNHVWLRGDLEYGAMQGTRFVEKEDGILADLDPSFALVRPLENASSAYILKQDAREEFVQALNQYVSKDLTLQQIEGIPENTMLSLVDENAAAFRNYLDREGLKAEAALQRFEPTVAQIDALPDALPYRFAPRESGDAFAAPTAYKLKSETERNAFLTQARHFVKVRVTDKTETANPRIVAEEKIPVPELYGNTLTVYFEAANDTTQDLTAKILIGGAESLDPINGAVTHGAPLVMEIAYQSCDFSGGTRPDPLEDPASRIQVFEMKAGGAYALALLPSLNSKSLVHYQTRIGDLENETATPEVLQSRAANPYTAGQALGPALDVTAQIMLSQLENFIQLGSKATGYRASTQGEMVLVGLEAYEGNQLLARPRYVFAIDGPEIPLAPAVAASDERLVDANALQNVLQLCREAVMAQASYTAMSNVANAITPGRLVRKANALGMPLFGADSSSSMYLTFSDRVPTTELAQELKRKVDVDVENFLVMPSTEILEIDPQNPDPDNVRGQGWSYLLHQPLEQWEYRASSPQDVLCHAFSEQVLNAGEDQDDLFSATALVYGAMSTPYYRLAIQALGGLDIYSGSTESISQAFVGAIQYLTTLTRTAREDPRNRLLGYAATIILLHALLDEFSRPEVLDLKIIATNEDNYREFAAGDVFNPVHYDNIKAVGAFNQIMDEARFALWDGTNVQKATHSAELEGQTNLNRIEATWTLKDSETNVLETALDADYNGPFELRLDGEISQRKTDVKSVRFVLDTQDPEVEILEWDPARTYQGKLNIRGSARDLHFEQYTIKVAPAAPEPEWRQIASSPSEVLGVGTLATWNAPQENANGNYLVQLTATDLAGNSASTESLVTVSNDGSAPTIEILQPVRSQSTGYGVLKGDAQLQVRATDQGTFDSGIKGMKVWIEYLDSGLYTHPSDPTKTQFQTRNATKELYQREFTGTLQGQQEYSGTIDSRDYQATGLSNDATITILATAWDKFGNTASTSASYYPNNKLFKCSISTPFLYYVNGRPESQPVWVRIFQNTRTLPKVELHEPEGTLGPETYLGDLKKEWPTESGAAQLWPPEYNGQFDYSTYYTVYGWYGSEPFMNGPGKYRIRVTQGDDSEVFEVYLVTADGDSLNLDITDPLYTVIDKASSPTVDIQGLIDSTVMDAWASEKDGEDPIESLLPGKEPYWILSYKPKGAQPVLDNENVPQDIFTSTFQYESNWKEIAHGFASVSGVLGTWEVGKLPEGVYDLRLLVHAGTFYASKYALGYKIVDFVRVPGEDAGSRVPGALQLRQTDLKLDYTGYALEVACAYDSNKSQELGDFGYGWSLEGFDLSVLHADRDDYNLGEKLEAEIKLPDGRELTYINRPMLYAGSSYEVATNAWIRMEAFAQRPFGQMLWIPGRTTIGPYKFLEDIITDEREDTDGWKKVQQLIGERPDLPLQYDYSFGDDANFGNVACLQLEDGSYLFFNWATGQLLRKDFGDNPDPSAAPARKIDYVYSGDNTTVTDHLGRTVQVVRDPETKLVTSVVDPRGMTIKYYYNDKYELAMVEDRGGGQRLFKYDDPGNPHFLTRMIIPATPKANHEADAAPGDTVIEYDYTADGRMKSMDTGAGTIGMEYEDGASGGVQTVVDEATGGQTEVHYNASGQVEKKVDVAGVVTTYEYFDEDTTHGLQGMLLRQEEGGVQTEFSYDNYKAPPFEPLYTGYEGIAKQLIEYRLWSGAEIVDDFAMGSNMKPGYLTSQQVQPKQVITPGIGPDGQPVDANVVNIAYSEGGDRDGTGRVFGVTDPEGRVIDLDYGLGAARNEIDKIVGPAGTEVNNDYYPLGHDDAGRLQQSQTVRGAEVLATTAYSYVQGTAATFGDMATSVSTVATWAGVDLETIWPNFAAAWIEQQTVTTTQTGEDPTISITYVDALGNTLLTVDGEGRWSATIPDAEGRALAQADDSRDYTQNTYDAKGLLTQSVSYDASEASSSTTEYTYDDEGRQIKVERDGKTMGQTRYPEPIAGQRSREEIEFGNTNITITDAAGRVVREEFRGADGAYRQTTYGYDEHGRRNYVRSSRGLETWTAFDDAGREVETRVRFEGQDYTSTRGYDAHGRVVWTQDFDQQTSYTTYLYRLDKGNPVLTAWTDIDDTTGVDDPNYGQLVALYHGDDNQDPTNNASHDHNYEIYRYDSQGRRTEVSAPRELSDGQIVAVKTKTVYDADGRVAAMIFNANDSATTDSETNVKFLFEYDEHGNREAVTYPPNAQGQTIQKTWQHFYDENERLARLVESQAGSGVQRDTEYDIDGLIQSVTTGSGAVIDHNYIDGWLGMKSFRVPDGLGGFNAAGSVAFAYDEHGRVNEVIETATNGAVTERQTGYDDESGRPAFVAGPEGRIDYTWDDHGSLASMRYKGRTVFYDWDDWGRLKTVRAPEGTWDYSWTAAGRKSKVRIDVAGKRLLEEYAYDQQGRLESITHTDRDTQRIVFQVLYDLGVDGQRLRATETRQLEGGGSHTAVWDYTYDPLGRLVGSVRTVDGQVNRTLSYIYDAQGNRTKLTDNGVHTNYAYHSGTQRLAMEVQAGTITEYTWTGAGELATRTTEINDIIHYETYTWGPEGTLTSVEFEEGPNDGITVTYAYDHEGERVGRKVYQDKPGGGAELIEDESYLVDRLNPTGYSQILATIDNKTGRVELNTWTDTLAAQTFLNGANSTRQVILADALGSVRTVSGADDTGNSFESHYDYLPFGGELEPAGLGIGPSASLRTHYAFTGQWFDQIPRLQSHRARWLIPSGANWLSPDEFFDFPLNFGASYSYVGQNPISRYDYSGDLGDIIESAVTSAIQGILASINFSMRIYEAMKLYSLAVSISTYFRILTLYSRLATLVTSAGAVAYKFLAWIQHCLFSAPRVMNQVWNKYGNSFPDVVQRGREIEQIAGTNLSKNFPVIDRWMEGIATSVKSLDTRAVSYQNFARLQSTVLRYIQELGNWQGQLTPYAMANGTRILILPSQVQMRVLELYVPLGQVSSGQWQSFYGLVMRAQQYGVQLVVLEL